MDGAEGFYRTRSKSNTGTVMSGGTKSRTGWMGRSQRGKRNYVTEQRASSTSC
jgi:hypothetical protein